MFGIQYVYSSKMVEEVKVWNVLYSDEKVKYIFKLHIKDLLHVWKSDKFPRVNKLTMLNVMVNKSGAASIEYLGGILSV